MIAVIARARALNPDRRTFIVGVSGVVTGLCVGVLSAWVVYWSTDTTVAAEDAQRIDEIRSETYMEYVTAYSDFALAADEQALDIEICQQRVSQEPGYVVRSAESLLRDLDCRLRRSERFVEVREAYRAARVAVHVHGSAAANRAADRVSDALPSSRNVPVRLDVTAPLGLDVAEFEAADTGFMEAMCRELSTDADRCDRPPR